MPIYAYRCESCGFQKDVLQKMSDPLLVTCPSCGASDFRKQLTAAGFQLKGSGWYVTDFRNPAAKEAAKGAKAEGSANGDAKSSEAPSEGKAAPSEGGTPAAPPAKLSGDAKRDAAPAKSPAPAPPPSTSGSS